MKNRKLRVGMIGAGGISAIHCKGWSQLDCAELVAISDLDLDAAARRAKEYDIPEVAETCEAIIARDDLDAVDIVVPNRFHLAYTVAALKAGKHVLCEKPLALTAKEVDRMIAAAQAAKRKLMCAQHQRFSDNSRALKSYLAKHSLGEIYYARAWYNRRRLLPGTPGFIYKANSGGGCCIDIGVHILDLALHLMDNFEPVSVSGYAVTKLARQRDSWSEWAAKYDKRKLDVEDFAAGFVRFANGAVLALECSFMLNQGPRVESRIDLFGTKAGAKWPECEVYDHTARDYADTSLTVRKTNTEAHCEEIRSFAESVLADKPVAVPATQSRAVIAILEGLYNSQQAGKEVKL